jgi:hypothetical protein
MGPKSRMQKSWMISPVHAHRLLHVAFSQLQISLGLLRAPPPEEAHVPLERLLHDLLGHVRLGRVFAAILEVAPLRPHLVEGALLHLRRRLGVFRV